MQMQVCEMHMQDQVKRDELIHGSNETKTYAEHARHGQQALDRHERQVYDTCCDLLEQVRSASLQQMYVP